MTARLCRRGHVMEQTPSRWVCRDCARARAARWYRAHPEQARANRQRVRSAPGFALRNKGYQRRYRGRHPQLVATMSHDQREAKRAHDHAYYLAHKDAIVARTRAWQDAHPDKVRAWTHIKSLRRRGVPLSPDARAYADLLRRGPCSYCGRPGPCVIDHIVPVAAGGDSEIDNLTAACRRCNYRKHRLSLLEFIVRTGREASEEAA